jgi:hypothetical protein
LHGLGMCWHMAPCSNALASPGAAPSPGVVPLRCTPPLAAVPRLAKAASRSDVNAPQHLNHSQVGRCLGDIPVMSVLGFALAASFSLVSQSCDLVVVDASPDNRPPPSACLGLFTRTKRKLGNHFVYKSTEIMGGYVRFFWYPLVHRCVGSDSHRSKHNTFCSDLPHRGVLGA